VKSLTLGVPWAEDYYAYLESFLGINFSKQPGGNSGLFLFLKMMYNSGNHSSSILKNKERNQ
jgi:hypothetical protein